MTYYIYSENTKKDQMQAYVETQRFTQWWLWLILFGLVCIPVYAIISRALNGNEEINLGLLIGVLTIFILIGGLISFFWYIKLVSIINENGIKILFKPLVTKEIKKEDIESVEMVDYGFVGGWGIRFTIKYGTVYNTSGRMGMLIKLKSGKKITLGTQESELLEKAVKQYLPNIMKRA